MVDLFTCQMSDKIKRDQASSYKLYNFRYTCISEAGVQTYALSSWSEFYKFVRPSVVIAKLSEFHNLLDVVNAICETGLVLCLISSHTVIADAVVFIVLTLLDCPLPSWTYPFIFYLQVDDTSFLIAPCTARELEPCM